MSTLEKTVNRKPSSLTYKAGWKKNLDIANVVALCGELQAGRVLPPARIDKEGKLIQGHHRAAAHFMVKNLEKHVAGPYGDPKADESRMDIVKRWANGGNFALVETPMRCDVVDYADPDEAEIDQISENIRRRQPSDEERDAGLVRLVAINEKRIAAEMKAEAERKTAEAKALAGKKGDGKPAAKPAGKKGRPKTAKSKAVAAAAKQAGVSKDTVDRALERIEGSDKTPADAGPALDWFDLQPIADVDGAARKVKACIAETETKMIMVARLVRAAAEAGLPKSLIEGIDRDVKALGNSLSNATPTHACPSCKGLHRKTCPACGGVGYATKGQMAADVPTELLRRAGAEGGPMVRDGRGGFKPLFGDKPAPAKKGKKNTVTVKDSDGNESELTVDANPEAPAADVTY